MFNSLHKRLSCYPPRVTATAFACLLSLYLAACSTKKPEDQTFNNLIKAGQTAMTQGDRAAAQKNFQSALAHAEQTCDQQQLSVSLGSLADVSYALGKHSEAEQFCRRQIAIDTERLGANDMAVAQEYSRLGDLEQALKKYDAAMDCFQRAQSITQEVRGPSSPMIGLYLAKRARLYILQDKPSEGEFYYNRAITFLDDTRFNLSFEDQAAKTRKPLVNQLTQVQAEFAQYWENKGQLTKAEDLLSRAILALESQFGQGCVEAAQLIESQARIRAKIAQLPPKSPQ